MLLNFFGLATDIYFILDFRFEGCVKLFSLICPILQFHSYRHVELIVRHSFNEIIFHFFDLVLLHLLDRIYSTNRHFCIVNHLLVFLFLTLGLNRKLSKFFNFSFFDILFELVKSLLPIIMKNNLFFMHQLDGL